MSWTSNFLEEMAEEYCKKNNIDPKKDDNWEKAMETVTDMEDPVKEIKPKGYTTAYGYRGLIDGKYQLFSTEQEYLEILRA